jgi:hypothetical protein
MSEYYGLGHFHCKAHEELSKQQQSISSSFKSSPLSERVKLAQQELEIWKAYIESRKADLPEVFQISKSTLNRLHRVWASQLHRDCDSIEGARMLDFHYQFTEHYQFDIPTDKRSLFEMVHPHAGYMVCMPYRFTFNKLIDFYNVQLVATYERSLGEEILSRQISCFNYFSCIAEPDALLDLNKANQVMQCFKFQKFENLIEFKKYFQWTLKEFPDEFKGFRDGEPFLRFALVRKIFLDYGL